MIKKLEALTVSRAAVTRLFAVAIAFVLAGSVSGAAVVVWALAKGAIAIGGPHLVSLDAAPVAGAIVGLIVASLLTGIGTLAAVASWAGALLNTARLEDKTWFAFLLVLGVVSLGWLAMVAYAVAGPDGSEARGTSAESVQAGS